MFERKNTMQNFNELRLPETLLQSLAKMQFNTPTPIQAQAIPVALEGRDILGSAQTGTGKTAAFGIPMVAHIMNSDTSAALIMTPTRELAVQVMQMLKKLIGHSNNEIKTALLIGGENMFRQFSQLEDEPRIIVGTPGRINDHLSRKSLKLNNVDFLVLDETDRMLDMGFGVQIDKVLTYMPQQRQTLMFSATLPHNIIRMAERYTKNAARIAVGSTTNAHENIKQEVIKIAHAEKHVELEKQLDARGGSIIVFVRTKHGADRMARRLEREGHDAKAIHGDLRQNQRDKVIRMFREKKIRILVATDVAARGLDVPHIEHVINYDLPQCPEDYIHRIGRTARAGAEGEAICFVSPEENGKWIAIERLMGGKGDEEPQRRQPGKAPRRNRNSSGFGRKNQAFGAGKRLADNEHRQERKRKPHRKGQSWQKAHDDRKAQEAAVAQPVERFERKFERRDEKQANNNRPQRSDKPWQKRERSEGGEQRSEKPWQKKREGGENRSFQKRDRNDRPFQKRDRDDRPQRSDKPWQKRERNDGENRPQRSDKPWQKKRDGGSDKPWQKKREGGENRSFQKRDRDDRPFQKRDRDDRPFQKREGSDDRGPKRFGGKPGAHKKPRHSKPWEKKGEARRWDGDKPFRKNGNAA
jgi:ATP-dependent RNA helicase DeaD